MSLASRKLIQAAAGAGVDTGDDDFANVVLLLDGDGTSGDNNETFTDSSANGFTVTESGSVVQGSFSPYGDNWSVYFDGSSYLNTASGATALGTGAFTVEFWINTTDTSFNIMNPDSSTGNGFWGLMVQSGDLRWNNQYNLTNLWVVDGAPILDGQWHHVAIVSSSSVFKVFYDGVSQSIQSGSFTDSYNYPYNDGLRIGSGNLATFKGYLSNIRLVSGTAIYSSDFDVPTGPFTNSASYTEKLLACQSNRFIDNGNSSYSITTSGSPKVSPFSPFKDDDARDITTDGGSMYGDGSNSYLTVADNADFDFGTGDFTVSGWFYKDSTTNNMIIIDGRSTGNTTGWVLYERNDSKLDFWHGSSLVTSSSTLLPNQWYYFHISRSGSSLAMYINGASSSSATNTTSLVSHGLNIGAKRATASSSTPFEGYLSDVNIVKGTATSNAVPTSPIASITDTSLLLNFQDSGINDRSGINNLDTVGNAQIDTAVKKYGTGSLEFDGSGDYLQTIPTEELYFTDKDFTVEGWVYLNNLSSTQTFFYYGSTNRSTSNASGIAFSMLYQSSSGYFRASSYYASTGGFSGNNTLVTPSANQWYHVAYYRIGSQFYLAVDGNVANIGSFTQPLLNGTSWVFRAGLESDSIGNPLNGYLDDIRITMGKARYGTSNFTPPDAALPKF